ncbi:hypothetical protein [Pseudoalteromonas aurantia]|uniref:Uncharacterized protein n=1 Tax=Pseudoalteromonas aurantia TaxID=43654 RepID=A0ABY2VX66_9GAMM|nr:hypothetical protein [Pseudoalteromonas aurantia]TMO74224.1 hypothetical protein CWC20_11220 [Pseudoalteromonas aurantia]
MRTLLLTLCMLVLGNVYAAEKKKQLPPLNPAYKAEHAMVLMNRGSRIYAANFPTYTTPHDVQVVYQIDNPDVAFLNLVRDANLITIKPKPFNIERLMRGEEITVTADIYEGHYKQGGSLVYSDRDIVFSKQLYSRKLTELAEPSKWQEYDMITVKGTERIYVHKIQNKPSFNHLIFVDLTGACLQKFRTSKVVPPANELIYKFVNCGTLKQLYYDTSGLE